MRHASSQVKQGAVIEFLSGDKETPTEIHRRLKAIYVDDSVVLATVNRGVIKFRDCDPRKAIFVYEKRSDHCHRR